MAYNFDNEESVVLGLVDKNDHGEKIQIQKITNKKTGSESIDVRLMYTPEGSTSIAPTKKGVRFSTDILLPVVEALLEGLSEDERQEIVDKIS